MGGTCPLCPPPGSAFALCGPRCISQFLLADIPSLSGSATVFGLLRMPTVAITGILVVAGSAAIGFTNVVLSLILEESVRMTITRFELIQTPLEGSHRMTITRFERIQTPLEGSHRMTITRFELIQAPLERSQRMTITTFERIQTPLEQAHRISFSSLSQCTGTDKIKIPTHA